jgi:hypothetical protein
MADGGFRPAFNIHLTTETESKLIVDVEANNEGTDLHAMIPLAEQLE